MRKSKLAADLDRFRRATEKIVGKERQKYVQGTGRLVQEQGIGGRSTSRADIEAIGREFNGQSLGTGRMYETVRIAFGTDKEIDKFIDAVIARIGIDILDDDVEYRPGGGGVVTVFYGEE